MLKHQFKLIILFSFAFCNFIAPASATVKEIPGYDEVLITVSVKGLGVREISAVIDNNAAFLSLTEIFDFLKTKYRYVDEGIDGYFPTDKDYFQINYKQKKILLQGRAHLLKTSDAFITESGVFLSTQYLNDHLNLNCRFSIRTLAVDMDPAIEFPAIILKKQETIRKNLDKLKIDRKPDTVISGNHAFFNLGVADWQFTSSLLADTGVSRILKTSLNLGGALAGGEFNIRLNCSNNSPFSFNNQFYKWRFVNTNSPVFSQLTVGRFQTSSISSLYAPITGIEVTNAAPIASKTAGNYRLSELTEPGSVVELYISSILVAYTKADADGYYSFNVPLFYGSTAIKLRFYSPSGKETEKDEIVNIPYIFIPPGKLQYLASAGIVSNQEGSKFFRTLMNYGVNAYVTIGAGMEYPFLLGKFRPLPFVSIAARLAKAVIVSTDYVNHTRFKANVNYRLPTNLQLDLSYSHINTSQVVIKSGFQEEGKLALFIPYRGKDFSGYSRVSYHRFNTGKYKGSAAEFLVTASFRGANTSFQNNLEMTGDNRVTLSTGSFAISLPVNRSVRISPRLKYDYIHNNFVSLTTEVEKKAGKRSYFNFRYDYTSGLAPSYSLGLKLNFGFLQASLFSSFNEGQSSFIQTGRGSIVFKGANAVEFLEADNLGKGGILLQPFLDINCNGKKDPGEPKVNKIRIKNNGGRISYKKDSSILISGIEPYSSYFIEVENTAFENIGWKLSKNCLSVMVYANRFIHVELPVSVLGEAAGMVTVQRKDIREAIPGIKLFIYNEQRQLITTELTRQDGYFNFLGLIPGKYIVKADEDQLAKLGFCPSSPLSFTIGENAEGDYNDSLEIVLKNCSARAD